MWIKYRKHVLMRYRITQPIFIDSAYDAMTRTKKDHLYKSYNIHEVECHSIATAAGLKR